MAPAGHEVLVGGLEQVTARTLVWGGGLDSTTPMEWQAQPIYEGSNASPKYLAELEDAGHISFSNACDLVSTFDECAEPYMDPADTQAIVNHLTTAFLQDALGDEEAASHLSPAIAGLNWTAE